MIALRIVAPVVLPPFARDALGERALAVALDLAKAPSAYFADDARSMVDALAPRERLRLWARDYALTGCWLARMRREVSSAPTVPERLRAAIRLARGVVLTQRDVRTDLLDSAHDLAFWLSTAGRLLRGLTNCEGQNHLVMLLASPHLDDISLFETRELHSRRSRHTLLRVRHQGTTFYADAWGDVPLYSAERATTGPFAGLPTLSELRASALTDRQGISHPDEYRAGRPLRTKAMLTHPLVQPGGRGDASRTPGEVDAATFKRYLAARAHHLFGRPEDAVRLYREVLEDPARTWVERASTLQLERLGRRGRW